MKKAILLRLFPFTGIILFAQQKEEAEKLVTEGVAYHDKGDYNGAISKYDKALELDKDNLLALTEKAYSLLSLQKYDESITCCRRAIEIHPGEKDLKTVYVTYGNAFDGLKKTDKSIETYDEGIKQFPDYYQLYFNKGVTLSSVKKYDEAILCFQKSVILNPQHPGSHNGIARLSGVTNKRIPSLLAYCRFLVLEPQGQRAKANLASLQKIMKGNAEQTGEKSVTISVSPDMLSDTAANGKLKENSFTTTNLLLALSAGLDYDEKNKGRTEVQKFTDKLETVCVSLKESRKSNYGFYWDYYVPYFTEMKDKELTKTFAYIAFASSEDPEVASWLKSHESEITKFYDWSKSFAWKTNL
jgi:tetratricopeptide (TPR) repeat protein